MVFGVIVAFATMLAACAGPRPHARVMSVAPSPQPGCERVVVELGNDGRGEGQVELDVTLTSADGKRFRDARTVDLHGHDRLRLAVDIPAPAGTYVGAAEAKYPD